MSAIIEGIQQAISKRKLEKPIKPTSIDGYDDKFVIKIKQLEKESGQKYTADQLRKKYGLGDTA